ncbi:MAG: KH domain-containing protein [Actinomycetota bacterium]
MIAVLARGLVDSPDRVRVEREDDGDAIHLSLIVAPDDLGQVIGRGGRNARALRQLLRAASRAQGTRATLEIVDV